MTSDIVVERTSKDADFDAVAALEAASFTNPWTREMLEREMRHSDVARLYVLRGEGLPVAAFCTCWVVHEELHINTIAVHPELRRRGLGSRLMEHLLDEMGRQGVSRAYLEVRRSNLPALALYERLGFSITGVRQKYYSHPEEDALMLAREGETRRVAGRQTWP
jgi:[ribosomal protein S18]-alanine N-acetyltransferase